MGLVYWEFPPVRFSVRLFDVCHSIHRLIQPFIFVIDGGNDPVCWFRRYISCCCC